MAPKARDDDLCQALLKFVTDDTVPEAQNVVAAEFPSSAIPLQLQEISKAKQDVESEISALSRETAGDLEGWVSQARQLHADIERSRSMAREIVKQHEDGRALQKDASDATNKVEQLRKEIAFNRSVTEALEAIRNIYRRIASAQDTRSQGQLREAIVLLEEAETLAGNVNLPQSSPAMGVVSGKVSTSRQAIITALKEKWDSLVQVDVEAGKLVIVSDDTGTSLDTAGIIESLGKLDMSNSVIDPFQDTLYKYILNPVLLPSGEQDRTLRVEGHSVYVKSVSSKLDVPALLDAVVSVLRYLQNRLPSSVTGPVFEKLVPTTVSTLITRRLLPSMPLGVSEMDKFQGLIERIHQFAKDIDDIGCGGARDLVTWAEQIPRLWLSQRRIRSLDEVRIALSESRGQTQRVERVEKGSVSQNDELLAENGVEDDWNADWGSDQEEVADNTAKPVTSTEEEDMSAWDFDDEDTGDVPEQDTKKEQIEEDEDDTGEAWGWGDDNEEVDAAADTTVHAAKPPSHTGQAEHKPSSRREITLKEYYSISDIPKSIIEVITQQISDAESLQQPEHSKLKIASSAPALLGLPTLVIAMFKATAPLFYPQKFSGGQMLLYNDSMYLSEQLRDIMESHNLPRLKSDVETLEKFGRIAYSKEMQSQRTILTDLLDVGQGFASCSEQPYQGECENAIRATVDRIRDVHREWQSILSHSALLQSIGSLLASAISKMILDVEDLSDISDAESQHLAKFCNQISQLEDLFRPEASAEEGSSEQVVAMTAMYVPNWLRFQYLINILESSLADIKYLWTEGELKLEFSPEEVVGLIKALFADSDHRRKAITDIRSG